MKEGTGLIISKINFKNVDSIIKILTKDGMIISGLAKNSRTKKNMSIYQIGNYVTFQHIGRENTLGIIHCQIIKFFIMQNINNRKNFLIITYICKILADIFNEIDSNNTLLEEILDIFEKIDDKNIKINLMKIEREILSKSGYIDANSDMHNKILIKMVYDQMRKTIPEERRLLEKMFNENSIDYQ